MTNDRLEMPPAKKTLLRVASLLLASLSLSSGLLLSYFESALWPLLPTGLLLFLAYAMWSRTKWMLEVGPEAFTLTCGSRRFSIPWSEVGEFAPGHGVEKNKVEFTMAHEETLARAYRGSNYLKLRSPRFFPDNFGLPAEDLAKLLNSKKKEYSPTTDHCETP